VEHAEWMNAEVREEIEDLQRTHGFEEREAIAYWHLAEARRLMVRWSFEDEETRLANVEEEYGALSAVQRAGREMSDSASHAAEVEARIGQHFSALYRELGLRVLRRSYPEGWADTRI
jgi:hypothetical protein